MVLIHHLLLVASAVLLVGAGARAASRLTDVALERLVAAAPLAASAAAIEALALGLVGLGTNAVALFAGAAGAWLATWRLVPAASQPLIDQGRPCRRGTGWRRALSRAPPSPGGLGC